jgi:Phage integrase family
MTSKLQDTLSYAPRGLRADRAAAYVGMSRTKFRELVDDGPMPKPLCIDGIRVWDRLDEAFAFASAYEARLKAIAGGQIEIGNVTFIRGSLGRVIDQFLGSAEWRDRAMMTRKNQRPLFDQLRRKYGAGMLRDLSSKHVKLIRNEVACDYSTSMAKTAIGLIPTVWKCTDEYLNLDLTRIRRRAFPDWCRKCGKKMSRGRPKSSSRLITLRHPAIGSRCSCRCLLDSADPIFCKWTGPGLTEQSSRSVSKKPTSFCRIRALRRCALLSGRTEPGRSSRTNTDNGLARAFRDVLRKIGINGIHGLRKNATVALAEAGCTDREIMAIAGHRTVAMVTNYTRKAEQKQHAVAAIEKWEKAESAIPRNLRRAKVPNLLKTHDYPTSG